MVKRVLSCGVRFEVPSFGPRTPAFGRKAPVFGSKAPAFGSKAPVRGCRPSHFLAGIRYLSSIFVIVASTAVSGGRAINAFGGAFGSRLRHEDSGNRSKGFRYSAFKASVRSCRPRFPTSWQILSLWQQVLRPLRQRQCRTSAINAFMGRSVRGVRHSVRRFGGSIRRIRLSVRKFRDSIRRIRHSVRKPWHLVPRPRPPFFSHPLPTSWQLVFWLLFCFSQECWV